MSEAIKRYVTLEEGSNYCSLSEKTLRRLIARHELTDFRPVGGRVLLDLHELDRLIRRSAGRRSTRTMEEARAAIGA